MILPKKAHFIHRTPTHKDEGLNGIEIFMIQSFYMTMYVKKRGKKQVVNIKHIQTLTTGDSFAKWAIIVH